MFSGQRLPSEVSIGKGVTILALKLKKEITKSLRIELPETATAPRKRNSHFKPHTDALPQSFWNNNESKTETPAA